MTTHRKTSSGSFRKAETARSTITAKSDIHDGDLFSSDDMIVPISMASKGNNITLPVSMAQERIDYNGEDPSIIVSELADELNMKAVVVGNRQGTVLFRFSDDKGKTISVEDPKKTGGEYDNDEDDGLEVDPGTGDAPPTKAVKRTGKAPKPPRGEYRFLVEPTSRAGRRDARKEKLRVKKELDRIASATKDGRSLVLDKGFPGLNWMGDYVGEYGSFLLKGTYEMVGGIRVRKRPLETAEDRQEILKSADKADEILEKLRKRGIERSYTFKDGQKVVHIVGTFYDKGGVLGAVVDDYMMTYDEIQKKMDEYHRLMGGKWVTEAENILRTSLYPYIEAKSEFNRRMTSMVISTANNEALENNEGLDDQNVVGENVRALLQLVRQIIPLHVELEEYRYETVRKRKPGENVYSLTRGLNPVKHVRGLPSKQLAAEGAGDITPLPEPGL